MCRRGFSLPRYRAGRQEEEKGKGGRTSHYHVSFTSFTSPNGNPCVWAPSQAPGGLQGRLVSEGGQRDPWSENGGCFLPLTLGKQAQASGHHGTSCLPPAEGCPGRPDHCLRRVLIPHPCTHCRPPMGHTQGARSRPSLPPGDEITQAAGEWAAAQSVSSVSAEPRKGGQAEDISDLVPSGKHEAKVLNPEPCSAQTLRPTFQDEIFPSKKASS